MLNINYNQKICRLCLLYFLSIIYYLNDSIKAMMRTQTDLQTALAELSISDDNKSDSSDFFNSSLPPSPILHHQPITFELALETFCNNLTAALKIINPMISLFDFTESYETDLQDNIRTINNSIRNIIHDYEQELIKTKELLEQTNLIFFKKNGKIYPSRLPDDQEITVLHNLAERFKQIKTNIDILDLEALYLSNKIMVGVDRPAINTDLLQWLGYISDYKLGLRDIRSSLSCTLLATHKTHQIHFLANFVSISKKLHIIVNLKKQFPHHIKQLFHEYFPTAKLPSNPSIMETSLPEILLNKTNFYRSIHYANLRYPYIDWEALIDLKESSTP